MSQLGLKGIIAIIISVGCLALIGMGVVQGKIGFDVLLPFLTAWVGAVIGSVLTTTVMKGKSK